MPILLLLSILPAVHKKQKHVHGFISEFVSISSMTDQRSQEIPQSSEVQKEEMVRRNVAQLKAVILRQYSDEFPQGASAPYDGVHQGEGMFVYKETETGMKRSLDQALTLVYDTRTGQFGVPSQEFELGDYSRVHTYVRSVPGTDEPSIIQLLNPAGALTIRQLNAYVTGDEPVEHSVIVEPQAIIPEYPELVGIPRAFGEHTLDFGVDTDGNSQGSMELAFDPTGDDIVAEAIRRFNSSQASPPQA